MAVGDTILTMAGAAGMPCNDSGTPAALGTYDNPSTPYDRYQFMEYAPNSNQYAYWYFTLPDWYVGGGTAFKVWLHHSSSGTGTLDWECLLQKVTWLNNSRAGGWATIAPSIAAHAVNRHAVDFQGTDIHGYPAQPGDLMGLRIQLGTGGSAIDGRIHLIEIEDAG